MARISEKGIDVNDLTVRIQNPIEFKPSQLKGIRSLKVKKSKKIRDRYHIESRIPGERFWTIHDTKANLDHATYTYDFCKDKYPDKEWRITYRGRVIDG